MVDSGDEDRLCALSLEEVSAEIRTGHASPVEVVEAVLARIGRLQPRLNAFITVTADQALTQAEAAEREIAHHGWRGVLQGVPMAYKDLFATNGVRTTAGSKVLTDWVPGHDAEVVSGLSAAGAICVGKLGMHEFAYGTTSDNPHYGPIRNPWDPERIPGGSSGGSAVATTTGMAFATMGSDTGGSIRIPASDCGCVGVMPTYGRVSLGGVVPLSWSLDHVGPLTRTVRDGAVVLQVIAGHDPLDPSTQPWPVPDFLDRIEDGPSGLRIGVPRNHFWDDIDDEIGALVRAAILALEAAGARIVETEFADAELYSRTVGTIVDAEAAAYHSDNYPVRQSDYGIADTLRRAGDVSATAYAKALQVMQRARAGAADSALDGVDVLAVPTMQRPPPTIEQVRAPDYRGRRTRYTSLLDLTGQPVVTVPCGLTAARWPTGISFVARAWHEADALRAARAYEQVRGPFPSPPVRP